ncbi:MAG: hypothetical protein K9G83_07050 [Hyphomonadaceae bacterium]|nr:hypothetical protein [Hyphomonadaceae bacterium]
MLRQSGWSKAGSGLGQEETRKQLGSSASQCKPPGRRHRNSSASPPRSRWWKHRSRSHEPSGQSCHRRPSTWRAPSSSLRRSCWPRSNLRAWRPSPARSSSAGRQHHRLYVLLDGSASPPHLDRARLSPAAGALCRSSSRSCRPFR